MWRHAVPVRQDLMVFSAIKEIYVLLLIDMETESSGDGAMLWAGSAAIRSAYGQQEYVPNQKSRWLIKISWI